MKLHNWIFSTVIFALVQTVSATPCSAQPFQNLVLEGAGIRGIAYAGSIKTLEENNLISKVERVGGTSAGAIAALCVSLGYSAQEIENIIYEMPIQKLNDGKFVFIGGISRVRKNYGWYRGNAASRWIGKLIEAKTGNSEITFQELHERKFRDLYVTGTSINHQKLIVFSVANYPRMKVKEAVRISMTIPLYFEAVFIDSVGNVINRKDLKGYFDIMVDGGLTGNYPISIFDSTAMHPVKKSRTLGLRIDTPGQIDQDIRRGGLAPVNVDRFRSYLGAFYNYVVENLNRGPLTEADWQRTVSISCGDIGPKIRKLSKSEKDQLISNGEIAMENYLQNHQK